MNFWRRWGTLWAQGEQVMAWMGLMVLAVAVGWYFARSLAPWGPWAFSDSAVYVTEGWNWAHGAGAIVWDRSLSSRWVTMFAPGYPWLLAIGFRWTSNWIAVARGWDVLLVALWVFLVGAPALQWVRPPWAVWSVASLFLLVPVVRAFSGIMSEPPFLVLNALFVWALWYVLRAKEEGEAGRRFWGSVFLSAMMTLTRWAGAWSVLPLVWVGWSAPADTRKVQLRRVLGGAMASPLVFVLWLFVGHQHGARRGRVLVTSPRALWEGTRSYVVMVGRLGSQCLQGGSSGLQVGVWVGIVAVVVVLLMGWKRARMSAAGQWVWLWGATGMAWVPFLWVSHAAAYPSPSIDARMFTPALVALGLAVLGLVWMGLRSIREARMRAVVTVVGLLGLVHLWRGGASADFLAVLRAQGLGYTHRVWHEMMEQGVLEAAETLPSSAVLVSNDPEGVMLWLHRPVLLLTRAINETCGGKNLSAVAPSDGERQSVICQNGAVVLIAFSAHRVSEPFHETLRHWAAKWYPCYEGGDGGVFLAPLHPEWCSFR